jgi:hypothetical protein
MPCPTLPQRSDFTCIEAPWIPPCSAASWIPTAHRHHINSQEIISPHARDPFLDASKKGALAIRAHFPQGSPSCGIWQKCDERLISIAQECTSLVTRNRQSNIWCVLWLLQRRLYSLEYHSHSVFSGWNLRSDKAKDQPCFETVYLSDPSPPFGRRRMRAFFSTIRGNRFFHISKASGL